MYNILTQKLKWTSQFVSINVYYQQKYNTLKNWCGRCLAIQSFLQGLEGHIPPTRWSHKGRYWLNLISCLLYGGQIVSIVTMFYYCPQFTLIMCTCFLLYVCQDKYIVSCLILMSMVCIWHAIVGHLPSGVADVADYVALATLIMIWLGFNVLFFFSNVIRVSEILPSMKPSESMELLN